MNNFKYHDHSKGAWLWSVLIILVSCKASPSASGLASQGTPVAAANLKVSLAQDGRLKLETENGAEKAVTSVSSLTSETTIVPPSAGTYDTPQVVAKVRLTAATVQLNGVSTCSGQFAANEAAQGVFSCIGPSPHTTAVASPSPSASLEASVLASSFTIVVTPYPGMTCALSHGALAWQKAFDVSLKGDSQSLEQVSKVTYDVYPAYPGNGVDPSFTSSNPAHAFALGKRFLTPVTYWPTGPATVQLKSGRIVKTAPGLVQWTNDDPSKKGGSTCKE